jgi:hypothetical protein
LRRGPDAPPELGHEADHLCHAIHAALIRAAACFVAALLALVAASAPAEAAPERISGTLSKHGYTVIALASGGKATSVPVKKPSFRVRPPAKRVTLHLRTSTGQYGGPIVIGRERKGKRAILGVRAGARLGRIKIGRGYAKVAKRRPSEWIDGKRFARAKNGVPIGARRFGRVRSKPPQKRLRGDLDLDGIPDPLDVDDDGDLILDSLDSSATGSARASRVSANPSVGGVANLTLELFRAVNANAAGLTDEQIDAALAGFGSLDLGSVGIQADAGTAVELDCGDPDTGLVYCRQNASSGRKLSLFGTPLSAVPFPSCCDPDGDGFGSLDLTTVPGTAPPSGASYDVRLLHGAASTQIRTGDLLIGRATIGGKKAEFPATLQYVYNTVPALFSYSDEAGNWAAPSYPAAPRAPGNRLNGFPVADGPDRDSDIEVTLTLWRPQRKPIPDEAGRWTDIGHQLYAANVVGLADDGLPKIGPACPEGAYSENDPNLTPARTRAPGFGPAALKDSASDRPADGSTLRFTLNLTRCLASIGARLDPATPEWGFSLNAIPANTRQGAGNAGTIIYFRRKQGSYQNPVYGLSAPDPMALSAGTNDYYVYHTGARFPILRSSDLVTWTEAGTALARRPAWVVTGDWHPWAPSVLRDSAPCPGSEAGPCHYLYYVGLHDETLVPSTHCVGVAVSPAPGGPFSDMGPLTDLGGSVDQSGRPPGCGDDYGYSNIDPAPFVDDDGSAYLYVSTSRFCAEPSPHTACPMRPTVSVIPLAADKVHASGPRKPLFAGDATGWERQTVEGPWMEKRGSTYYLFYSGGNYRAAYGMGYATASSPLGADAFPAFAKSSFNPVLQQDVGVLSPGGGSMIEGPQGGNWLIYHGRAGDYTQPQTLRIDPVWFETNGSAAVSAPTVGPQTPAP